MTNKALTIFNQLRPLTVGFDDTFRHFESMFDHQLDHIQTTAFPHYNIVKMDKNKYDIQIALAGYNKKDIDINLEEGVLTIESKKDEKKETKLDSEGEILHKGIAKRYFKKSFTIAEDCKVIGAELKDGLLRVSLERIVPEHKKARTISIK
jgi:molecular chaperone IbpA|tara:strand:- start:1 stop:453 length:453 start_codon:yes stop_codon:yes gene_type:complete